MLKSMFIYQIKEKIYIFAVTEYVHEVCSSSLKSAKGNYYFKNLTYVG